MKQRTNTAKAARELLTLAVLSVLIACGADTSTPGPERTLEPGDAEATSAPKVSAAQRIYIDPETGEVTTPPPRKRGEEPDPSSSAFSTSHEGLVETPSPVPGGGTKIDLKGRFRSPLSATVDDHGQVQLEHKTDETDTQEDEGSDAP